MLKTSVLEREDRDFFARELDSFVPDYVFDAHTHFWHSQCNATPLPDGFPSTTTLNDYERVMADTLPNRTFGGWFLPKPHLHDIHIDAQPLHELMSRNLEGNSNYGGALLVRPWDDPEQVREQIQHFGLPGMKCYHLFADTHPTWEADIPTYLPENLVRVADEESLAITLHIVKSRAVADPVNLHWIRHYCETYPNMKLILAHSARGFQPSHNLEGLPKLVGLNNLYFDTSANCEMMAHQSILQIFGHKRLLYGSDFGMASHGRGRSVATQDSFIWLNESTPVWEPKHQTIISPPVIYESLRSLKWACWSSKLTDSQIEDIFWNNAAELFKCDVPAVTLSR